MIRTFLHVLFILAMALAVIAVPVSAQPPEEDWCSHGGHEPVIIIMDNFPVCVDNCECWGGFSALAPSLDPASPYNLRRLNQLATQMGWYDGGTEGATDSVPVVAPAVTSFNRIVKPVREWVNCGWVYDPSLDEEVIKCDWVDFRAMIRPM